jgi:hypothetical protein
MQWVGQEDSHGCLVACLAMVTGTAYKDVRQWFIDGGQVFHGVGGGTIHFYVEQFLSEHGYASMLKYRHVQPGNRPRDTWPLPPFAPAHIVGVNGAGRHGVVLTSDGVVLDPENRSPRHLSDYQEVGYMIGIWNVR